MVEPVRFPRPAPRGELRWLRLLVLLLQRLDDSAIQSRNGPKNITYLFGTTRTSFPSSSPTADHAGFFSRLLPGNTAFHIASSTPSTVNVDPSFCAIVIERAL